MGYFLNFAKKQVYNFTDDNESNARLKKIVTNKKNLDVSNRYDMYTYNIFGFKFTPFHSVFNLKKSDRLYI